MTLSQLVSSISVGLKTEMSASEIFPFDRKRNLEGKLLRSKSKLHMKTVAFDKNPIIVVSPDMQVFELGSEDAEKRVPYYHILEDAKRISNPNRSTRKTRGSQGLVADKAKRDYSVPIPGKSSTGFVQEYRQPFKEGRRSYFKQSALLADRNYNKRNEPAKFRYNIHFAYIERILEEVTPKVASQLGIRLASAKGLNVAEVPLIEMVADVEDNGLLGGLGI